MDVDHAKTNAVLAWSLLIGYWICYPVWLLFLAVVLVLRLLYRPLAFLALPVVYLGRFTLACIAFPFRAAAKLETIYIFLGVAALVGIFGGVFVRSIYAFLYRLLKLDARPQPKLRTAKQYREEKRKKKEQTEPPLTNGHLSPSPASPSSVGLTNGIRKGKHRRTLLEQTIMEEDDSEF